VIGRMPSHIDFLGVLCDRVVHHVVARAIIAADFAC